MRKELKNAVRESVQDLIESGVQTSFTEKELKSLGVTFHEIAITPGRIRRIRKESKYSQSVFARVLNVSISSVRQWEQGSRKPSGSAQVLLELLEKDPRVLDYRIRRYTRNGTGGAITQKRRGKADRIK